MPYKIIFFILIILYMQIILFIYINNKLFKNKINNKNLKLKIIKIKKINNYLDEKLEIINNDNYE